jgi:hypothetical protein
VLIDAIFAPRGERARANMMWVGADPTNRRLADETHVRQIR